MKNKEKEIKQDEKAITFQLKELGVLVNKTIKEKNDSVMDLLLNVLNNSQEGFVVLSPLRDEQNKIVDFRYLLVNDQAERMLRRTKAELFDKKLLDVFPGVTQQGILDLYIHVAETGKAHRQEFQYTHEGFDNWFIQSIIKIEAGILVSTIDITDRKKAEEELKQANEQLTDAQELANMGNWVFYASRGESVWSAQVYKLFGAEPQAGESTFDVLNRHVFPEDLEKIKTLAAKAIEEVKGYQSTYRIKRADGALRMISTYAKAYQDKTGNVLLKGICQDITERLEAEESLKEKTQDLDLIRSNLPVILFRTDENGVVTEGVGKGLREIGMIDNATVGTSLFDRYPNEAHHIQTALNGGTANYIAPVPIQGKTFYFNNYLFFDTVNKKGMRGVSINITDLKEAELKFKESEHFRNKITDLVPGLIAVYNINTGKYLFVNDAIEPLLGYSKSELLEKGMEFFVSIIHPDDFSVLMEKIQKQVEIANDADSLWSDNHSRTFEYRLKHKNGEWKWFLTNGIVFDRNKQGKVEHILNLSFDISTRHFAEEELLKNKSVLSEAQEIAKLGSWEWDIPNNVVKWTDELYKMYGYEPDSIQVDYTVFLNHTHPDDLDMVHNVIQRSYANGEPFTFEHRIIQPTGAIHVLLAKGRVVSDLNGKVTKMIGVALDITERKIAEEELRRKSIDVETQKMLNEKKDEFIGVASHELKTPLTSIKAYVQLLQRTLENIDSDISEACMPYVSKANIHIERLGGLIADLLDVSKIQAGKLQYNFSEFDFDEFIKSSLSSLQYTAQGHQLIVTGEVKQIIKGDVQRLEQVLSNLISNAVKYSPNADRIMVRTVKENGHIQVAVTDYGVGIPKDYLHMIFERFYRVEKTAQKFSGLGIGLYISSEIVQRHGGKMWVESEEEKGTTFYFTLPAIN